MPLFWCSIAAENEFNMDSSNDKLPMSAWFLGPKSEQAGTWQEVINYIFQDYAHWRRNYFPEDPQVLDRAQRRSHDVWFDKMSNELDFVLNRLKADYPFYSPRYLAHMVSEISMPGIMGYFAGMLYNPNNVSEESAPVTTTLEIEAGKMIAAMLGYDTDRSWSHITSGGTIANLEALWLARQTHWIPLMVWEVCQQNDIELMVKMPNGRQMDIRYANTADLLHLTLDEKLELPARLASHSGLEGRREALAWVASAFQNSIYNIGKKGTALYRDEKVEPVIIVSEAAHYSIRKIANLLGIGESQVISVPVDARFRLSVKNLEKILFGLGEHQVVLAVIGIIGTTEEGAIDPMHELVKLREKYQKERNRWFWIHADAAWGGYIRSLYVDDPTHPETAFPAQFHNEAMEALHLADSITIDPHKMGYIQYPSGVINFRDKRVVLYARQKAPYIHDDEASDAFDTSVLDEAIGPFILEGSKPGAAALATWLSHKTIPLHRNGHGKMIAESLANARRLHHLLSSAKIDSGGWSMKMLAEPDSNIVCYLVHDPGKTLAENNAFNEELYQSMSLKASGQAHSLPYDHDFFVSRTRIHSQQYQWASVATLMTDLGYTRKDYEQEGLFVLRSVVINPWLTQAREKGTDYLQDFAAFLMKKITEAKSLVMHETQKAPLSVPLVTTHR